MSEYNPKTWLKRLSNETRTKVSDIREMTIQEVSKLPRYEYDPSWCSECARSNGHTIECAISQMPILAEGVELGEAVKGVLTEEDWLQVSDCTPSVKPHL